MTLIGGPRATENIPVYWKNFTSGLSFKSQYFWSAFATSLSRHQASSSRNHTIARLVCLLKRARFEALSEGNMRGATHVMGKVQSFRVDCTLCRIKQMLVFKNGAIMGEINLI